MIAIVSSAAHERTALAALCEQRGWKVIECQSVRALRRLALRIIPRVLLVRHQLEDGYADDVIAMLHESNGGLSAKIVVLLPAATPTSVEARQIEIGADCVQRDPIRPEVLLAYLGRFLLVRHGEVQTPPPSSISFAGGTLDLLERTFAFNTNAVPLTPREVVLAETLANANGNVVSYESLYSDVLDRRFCGDTSNMRVLLGKLAGSMKHLGISLHEYVEVIPKTGYRYSDSKKEPSATVPLSIQKSLR